MKLHKNILNSTLLILLAWFSWLMLEIIVEYRTLKTDVGFLLLKQAHLSNKIWLIAFFIHVFSSFFALAVGFTQFSKAFLRRYPHLHRFIGKVYVIDILCFSGISGLIMAFFAQGGFATKLAFVILAVLWLFTTTKIWTTAQQRNFIAHQHWVIRSYALTLSAVTLRLWKVFLTAYLHWRPLDAYETVAWLGFVPNILIAEWIIRTKLPPQ